MTSESQNKDAENVSGFGVRDFAKTNVTKLFSTTTRDPLGQQEPKTNRNC